MKDFDMMDETDWNSLLQYVAEPVDDPSSAGSGKLVLKGSLPHVTTPLATPQLPTPTDSHASFISPEEHSNAVVSVSTAFYPGAWDERSDVIFRSSDSVWFYANSSELLRESDNNFHSLLPPAVQPGARDNDPPPVIDVQEDSAAFNIVLHVLYRLSCDKYSPPIEAIEAAVTALQKYGVSVRKHTTPSSPLFSLLVFFNDTAPTELYTFAAKHDLYDLAALTSSYLHSIDLSTLTDDMAERMGPLYLKRLFFLHYGRADALKRILLSPPHPHAPTPDCDFAEQKQLTRAWALASAYLAWDARADLSTSSIEAALTPLEKHLSCEHCRATLKDRIRVLVVQWSDIKRTI